MQGISSTLGSRKRRSPSIVTYYQCFTQNFPKLLSRESRAHKQGFSQPEQGSPKPRVHHDWIGLSLQNPDSSSTRCNRVFPRQYIDKPRQVRRRGDECEHALPTHAAQQPWYETCGDGRWREPLDFLQIWVEPSSVGEPMRSSRFREEQIIAILREHEVNDAQYPPESEPA